MARQDLLDAAVAHVREHGVSELTLRGLADAIGTSHRMLVYYFGSREELLAEVVSTIEEQERQASLALVDKVGIDAFFEAHWKRLSSPRRAKEERLFFELAGQALQGRPGTEALRERLVGPWLEMVAEAATAAGVPVAAAQAQARLDMATVRGLLLDLLATGDRAGVDAAFQRYVKQREVSLRDRARTARR